MKKLTNLINTMQRRNHIAMPKTSIYCIVELAVGISLLSCGPSLSHVVIVPSSMPHEGMNMNFTEGLSIMYA